MLLVSLHAYLQLVMTASKVTSDEKKTIQESRLYSALLVVAANKASVMSLSKNINLQYNQPL
jgi:hypothetical protein